MPKFQDRVLQIVTKIPKGKVVSYGQVALMAGIPKAAILVGQILCNHGETTPWWRIINYKGFISTNCQDHTGLRQKKLLEQEEIPVDKNMKVDIEKFRWLPDEKLLKTFELDDRYIQVFIEKYLY